MNFGQVMQLQKAKDIDAAQGKVEQLTESEPEKVPKTEEPPAPQEPVVPDAQSGTPKAKPSVTRSAKKQSSLLNLDAERVATVRQLASDYKEKHMDGIRYSDCQLVHCPRSAYLKLLNLKVVCKVQMNVLLAFIIDRFIKELEDGLIDEKLNSQ